MLVVLVILMASIASANSVFISTTNLTNLLDQVVVYALLALGELYVIVAGDIDLSNASIVAASGVSYAAMAEHHHGLILAAVVALAIGVGIGVLNGAITVFGRIPSFITTLGTLTAVEGFVLLATNGSPIYNLPNNFVHLGTGKWFAIPISVWIVLVCAVVAWYVLAQRPFGRHLYAVGGNRIAAEVSGISVARVRIANFTIAGFLSALAGIIFASRIGSGDPTMGANYELDAIAAVVIGGGDLMGGQGSVVGTVIGVGILGVIANGLNILGVSAFWQEIAVGVIIVAAVILGRITSGGERAPV
jgi:ribose transport system permease protein